MRPTFVISIDEELIWGSFDHTPEAEFAAQYPDLRGVIGDLLAMFDRHDVPATWAVVGHMFLHDCKRGSDGRAHPDLVRPDFAWHPGDWFADDPCSDRERAPLWYGDDVVAAIRTARVEHEVASHSFSHIVYGDPGCSRAAAEDDLKAAVDVARTAGIAMKSFVFPRNVEGHHEALRDHGFTAYRGRDPAWYNGLGGKARRVGHLVDQALGLTPPVSLPSERLPGLWNVPGSMIFLPRGGPRSLIPVATRVTKAKRGLNAAIRHGKIFHLWFHSMNFCLDRTAMMAGLEEVVAEAARLRAGGSLDILTMGDIAAQSAAA